MVDRQLDVLRAASRRGRFQHRRPRPPRSIPAILEDPNLLVVYAESALAGGEAGGRRELLQWTAARAGTGEVFEAVLRPFGDPPFGHLSHLLIPDHVLARGEDLAGARRRFLEFAGGKVALAAWTRSTLDFGAAMLDARWPSVLLKTVFCNARNRRAGLLERAMREEGIAPIDLPCRGRARQRLGNALATARWLAARRRAAMARFR
ncbi:MAG: hypothetical protein Fur0037_09740 [Planctomycetota bacterium]